MSWLTSFVLYVFHAIYTVAKFISALRRHFDNEPRPLDAARKQVPSHLAILLALDEKEPNENVEAMMLDNVENAVSWCRAAGIRRLTVYDRAGVLSSLSVDLRKRLMAPASETTNVESEIEYPLTPPLSDDAESRPVSPDEDTPYRASVVTINLAENVHDGKRKKSSGRNGVKRRRSQHKESVSSVQPLTLHVVSRQSGKPALADVANHFLHQAQLSKGRKSPPEVSVNEITDLLEGEHGLPPADLMIVHSISSSYPRPILELYGFSPWRVRLTELYHTKPRISNWWTYSQNDTPSIPIPLDETDFRIALDEFDSAEMRLGK